MFAEAQAAGYPIFNMTLFSRNVSKHMDFSAILYNVLERIDWDPALPDYPMDKIQQDGRNFRVKLPGTQTLTRTRSLKPLLTLSTQ